MDKFKKVIFQDMLDKCNSLGELENKLVPILLNTRYKGIKPYMELKLNVISKASKFGIKLPNTWYDSMYYKWYREERRADLKRENNGSI